MWAARWTMTLMSATSARTADSGDEKLDEQPSLGGQFTRHRGVNAPGWHRMYVRLKHRAVRRGTHSQHQQVCGHRWLWSWYAGEIDTPAVPYAVKAEQGDRPSIADFCTAL